MHLLAAQAGALQQDGEAIDLGQTPAPLIFASAADSELAAMAAAADRAGTTQLRVASTLRLAHNLSVDIWIDATVADAKLVIVRLLGGAGYWPYGVDELVALAEAGNLQLALLPGDAVPDLELKARSTVKGDDWDRLHALLAMGGPDNFDTTLAVMRALVFGQNLPEIAPNPFPLFGFWWPGQGMIDGDQLAKNFSANGPNVPILFYRATLEGAGAATVSRLVEAMRAADLNPVPLFVSSLRQADCAKFVRNALARFAPEVIFNLTGFALGIDELEKRDNPFAETDAPIIQLLQAGRAKTLWASDPQGLSPRDLAMQVVMPELDGRVGGLIVGHKEGAQWHEATQCPLSAYAPDEEGIERAIALAKNYARLRQAPVAARKIALVLANYPIRDGRIANGVGYDAPQSTIEILRALEGAGYGVRDIPAGGNQLIERLQDGPTNANPARGTGGVVLSLADYLALFETLPEKIRTEVETRWGAAKNDPFCRADGFHLPVLLLGNVAIILQPARGYDRDDEASYHDPDLVPPHAYCAAYLWAREKFAAHALVHNGKHGNLEWLPGKATALDSASYPQALWGQLPHFYPFIVNDPGEGTQAKRRTGATIIDHLVPPLTRAETYGPLKELEALLDEYYAASGMDRRRLEGLQKRIFAFTHDTRLDRDIGIAGSEENADLQRIDTFLCDLKEAQIRDGLHIFGQSPKDDLERDLIVALARVPRGEGAGNASLIRALADDLGLGFDPLDAELGTPWTGPVPSELTQPWCVPDTQKSVNKCRRTGDIVERLETLAAALVSGRKPLPHWSATVAVLATVEATIRPRLAKSGPAEMSALLTGLAGKFVAPGPSGAPSRGRLDVLPTGKNFYSLDNRAVPTPTAWELGQKSAENLVTRHFQDVGVWLRSVALSVWGTANMRTGGDDIAQGLALIGAKPKWDPGSLRVSGYEIIPLAKLGRPRVDVTLRISGFFRDAFPAQIALFDRAARAIGALDEPEDQNPIAAKMRTDALGLMASGEDEAAAGFAAGHRIFGSKPGAYGAGLQGLMDSGKWQEKADLAEAFLNWGQYAYGAAAKGVPERARFAARLSDIDAVIHNQDNREHDLLDSDDYYQFEGGLSITATVLSGHQPSAYHNDHSRPERPQTRTLEEEVSRVVRSRVVNPKWLAGVMRHGYKGAFEIIATLDYMFAFAATTGAVKTHHFDLAFEAFVEDETVREFIRANNSYGYDELIEKFREARERGFWIPRSNSAHATLSEATK